MRIAGTAPAGGRRDPLPRSDRSDGASARAAKRDAARRALLAGGWLMGLLTEPAVRRFQSPADVDAAWVEEKIAGRDFGRADAICAELAARGVQLEDRLDGTRWRAARPTPPK